MRHGALGWTVAGCLVLSAGLSLSGCGDNNNVSDNGSRAPTQGNDGQPCFPNKTCSGSLSCVDKLCLVPPSSAGALITDVPDDGGAPHESPGRASD